MTGPKTHGERAREGIFVGYSDKSMGGYRIYMPDTAKFEDTHHASFGKCPDRGTRERFEDTEEDIDYFPELSFEEIKRSNIERVLLELLGREIKTHNATVGQNPSAVPPAGVPHHTT